MPDGASLLQSAKMSEVFNFDGDRGDMNRSNEANNSRELPEEVLLGRSLLSRTSSSSSSALDNRVRCTIFDIKGNVKVVSGEFSRSQLLSQHSLLPRDLRKLNNSSTTSIVPTILVRKNSILVNLLHIRALIKADLVILFDAYGSTDSKTQSIFMYDLEHKLKFGSRSMGGLPYEMRALEAVLISVVGALDAEMLVNKTVIDDVLHGLEDDIDRDKLRHLLVQSKKLSAFHQKATLIRDALDELLDQDEDLAGIYLTAKLQGQPVNEEDNHSEIEMLLESYYKHCDEIVQSAGSLLSNIRSTEEIINIILDSNRNNLMLLDLKFQIGTLAMGGGAFIAGLYGMNLQNFIEETDWGFIAVSGTVFFISSAIVMWGLRSLRRIQRVTMMSSEPRRMPREKPVRDRYSMEHPLLQEKPLVQPKEESKSNEFSLAKKMDRKTAKKYLSSYLFASAAAKHNNRYRPRHDIVKKWLKDH